MFVVWSFVRALVADLVARMGIGRSTIEGYTDPIDRGLLRAIRVERFEFSWGYVTQFGIVILRDSLAVPDVYERHYTVVHYNQYPNGTYLLVPDHPKLNLIEVVRLVLSLHNDPNYWAEILHDGRVLRVAQAGDVDEHAGN